MLLRYDCRALLGNAKGGDFSEAVTDREGVGNRAGLTRSTCCSEREPSRLHGHLAGEDGSHAIHWAHSHTHSLSLYLSLYISLYISISLTHSLSLSISLYLSLSLSLTSPHVAVLLASF